VQDFGLRRGVIRYLTIRDCITEAISAIDELQLAALSEVRWHRWHGRLPARVTSRVIKVDGEANLGVTAGRAVHRTIMTTRSRPPPGCKLPSSPVVVWEPNTSHYNQQQCHAGPGSRAPAGP
jgi:hypothetical protein